MTPRLVLLFVWTMCRVHVLFFFFSSRRRHTRLQGDWSSDVCSSDLQLSCGALALIERRGELVEAIGHRVEAVVQLGVGNEFARRPLALVDASRDRSEERRVGEEGRSRWSPDHLKKKKRR